MAALFSLSPIASAQSLGPVIELDRIVAIVNDDVIVLSELVNRLRTIKAQLTADNVTLPPDHVLQKEVLDRLVSDRLQIQIAEISNIRVDDDTLNRAVEDIAKGNKLSLREFRDILERDGYDFSKFRAQIRDEIMIARIRQRNVNSRITVSDRDVDNYLATLEKQGGTDDVYHISHILISLPEDASPDDEETARQRARVIIDRLRTGANFADTAIAESDGQQALEGGDLGWLKESDLPTLFADIVPTLKKGEVSDPIRSPSGFHIIKLSGLRGSDRHLVTQTKAQHILIRIDELKTDAQVKDLLLRIRERLVNDEPFSDMAIVYSDDTASATNGGDLGWLNPGDVVPDFQTVLDSLQPGEISGPFTTQFGWHIVQVVERREHDDTDQVKRTQAVAQIRARKTEEELQAWLSQIRDEAYVEFRLDE